MLLAMLLKAHGFESYENLATKTARFINNFERAKAELSESTAVGAKKARAGASQQSKRPDAPENAAWQREVVV